jgi:hypothetical protein
MQVVEAPATLRTKEVIVRPRLEEHEAFSAVPT